MPSPHVTRVVLHPHTAPGLAEHLRETDGIDLVTPDDDDGVTEALGAGNAEVLVTMAWRDEFLTTGLRWVQATTAGVEQFPLSALEDRGVVLTSATGVHAPAVGLHAFALLLALIRRVGESMRDVVQRQWQVRTAYELEGRTLGVLGLGSIGEEIARIAQLHGMKVIGTKRDPSAYRGVADRVVRPDETLSVCADADVLMVTLPSTPGSDGSIGAEEFHALGSGWFVNVGRGSVVDEPALVQALRSGRLMGAGLDVFAEEPLPADSPLWELPNVIITPHMAWSSDRLPARLRALFERNLAAHTGMSEWINRVA